MRQIHYLGLATMLTACADALPKNTHSAPNVSQDVTQSVGRYNSNGTYTFEGMMPISVTSNNQLITTPFEVSGIVLHDDRPASWYFASNDQTRQAGIAVYQEPAQARQGLYATTQQALSDRRIELDQPVNFTYENQELLFNYNNWLTTDGDYHCDSITTGADIIASNKFAKVLIENGLNTFVNDVAARVFSVVLEFANATDPNPIDPNAEYVFATKRPSSPTDAALLIQLDPATHTLPENILGERDADAWLAECRDDRPVRELRPDYGTLISCLRPTQEGMQTGQMGDWRVNDPLGFSVEDGALIAYAGPGQSYAISGPLVAFNQGLSVRARILRTGDADVSLDLSHIVNDNTETTHAGIVPDNEGSISLGCGLITPGAEGQYQENCARLTDSVEVILAVKFSPTSVSYFLNDTELGFSLPVMTSPDQKIQPFSLIGSAPRSGGSISIKDFCLYQL